jgi:hypothetical protein
MDVILPVLADPSIPDEQVGGILRNRVGMQMLRELNSDTWTPLPKDHGRLSELDSSYTYLRQFTPNVLAAIDFKGGPGTGSLIHAVAILKKLNATGGRKVPQTRRPPSCPPSTPTTWTRPTGPGRTPPTGTIGNCA